MRISSLLLLVFLPAGAFAAPRFAAEVYPVLVKANCAGCHNANGVASTTRLEFPEGTASAEDIDFFGASLKKLVNTADPAASLLVTKPTARVPHAGGERIKKDSPEEKALRDWSAYLATATDLPTARKPAQTSSAKGHVLRRLTHSQYDRTVRDLLGDSTYPSRQFPPEDFIGGFKGQYAGQNISPILTEAYGAAAERIAANWQGRDPGPSFVEEFGARAFRRPLEASERTRYAALYKSGGARLVIEAMLQSPAFLYRLDSTTDARLKPYARASRLSFQLWDSTPSPALLEAARKGELDTAAGVERWARRLLDDPRAKEAADEFIAQWLRFDRVITLVKERRAYPAFTREMALAMTEETRRLAAHLIWNDLDFLGFYTAPYSFLNSDLATLYRVPPPAEEFARVDLPAASGRAGILGHGTFLALAAKPSDTSITARGLHVRETFLCQEVPQPPPGVNANLPVQVEDKPRTNRELLQLHLSSPSCASCHRLIDPIGYGLERFDGIGGFRESVKVTIPSFNRKEEAKRVDLKLDAEGFIAGIADSQFDNPAKLGQILAASPQCQECVVKQYFRYASGRHESVADRELIRALTAHFRASGYKFRELMVALVKWSEFAPDTISKGD